MRGGQWATGAEGTEGTGNLWEGTFFRSSRPRFFDFSTRGRTAPAAAPAPDAGTLDGVAASKTSSSCQRDTQRRTRTCASSTHTHKGTNEGVQTGWGLGAGSRRRKGGGHAPPPPMHVHGELAPGPLHSPKRCRELLKSPLMVSDTAPRSLSASKGWGTVPAGVWPTMPWRPTQYHQQCTRTRHTHQATTGTNQKKTKRNRHWVKKGHTQEWGVCERDCLPRTVMVSPSVPGPWEPSPVATVSRRPTPEPPNTLRPSDVPAPAPPPAPPPNTLALVVRGGPTCPGHPTPPVHKQP